jgi:collagenase-like PrtC family protease
MRIPWVRPEDVPGYHALGITHFKLDGRIASASYNLERISAYLRGRHEGNLLYLLLENIPRRHEDLCETPDGFYRMYVDNARLDGLVAHMPCLRREISCRTCGFCDASAAAHVRMDPDWVRRRRGELEAEISGRYAVHPLDG